MKLKSGKIIVSLIIIALLQSVHSQSGWIQLSSPTNRSLTGLYVLDSNKGFCSGQYASYITINGGNNWSPIIPLDGNSIFFLNNSIGFIQGQSLYKTNDGGNNWSIITPLYPYHTYYDVYFLNENTGFRCGGLQFHITNLSYISKTTNSGLNWTNPLSVGGSYLKKIVFLDSVFGFCTGGEILYKTTNGGLNWISIIPLNDGMTFHSLYFLNSMTGFLCGNRSKILKTTNGGNNFSYVELNNNDYFVSIYFNNENTGYCVGKEGKIIQTTNSGVNWNYQYSVTNNDLFNVTFININTGFAVGNNGVILKTTNGGGGYIGIRDINSEIPNSFFLHQNYPNPFNPSTKFRFDIPPSPKGEGQGVRVTLKTPDRRLT